MISDNIYKSLLEEMSRLEKYGYEWNLLNQILHNYMKLDIYEVLGDTTDVYIQDLLELEKSNVSDINTIILSIFDYVRETRKARKLNKYATVLKAINIRWIVGCVDDKIVVRIKENTIEIETDEDFINFINKYV